MTRLPDEALISAPGRYGSGSVWRCHGPDTAIDTRAYPVHIWKSLYLIIFFLENHDLSVSFASFLEGQLSQHQTWLTILSDVSHIHIVSHYIFDHFCIYNILYI